VRIHLAGKHALEFQRLDLARDSLDIGGNRRDGAFVLLGFGQLQQFVRAAQAIVQAADAVDYLVELRALLAELLGTLGVVPDVRIFKLAANFLETFLLRLVVKDTP
jgi:hypothetical protein